MSYSHQWSTLQYCRDIEVFIEKYHDIWYTPYSPALAEQLQILSCGILFWFWDVQQRQGHLVVRSNVEHHAGDSELCVGECSWLSGPWMAPCSCPLCVSVCLSVSNAASGGKVGECNSYLPARPSTSSYTQLFTVQSVPHTAPVCMYMSVYVCAAARSHKNRLQSVWTEQPLWLFLSWSASAC